ncbi:hypothetical protein SCHPADRAFT_502939 [Schizopora paradoxa]|uniref:F-box domain-containing protein n=1 Tax=Schizopora paradoxa TaxID=27342 RepID=A0A0H2RGS6_9AGAM|nr:hypothetical protein SCHPADRAFT_502939 [Schizopora paradoxa]
MAHSLPEDVLYAIFLHALPSNFVLSTIGPSSKPWMIPPLTFSLVCRSWRLLVLSRPKLWRDISFESKIGSGKDYRDPRIKHTLIQWLSRSSSSPLWIDIEVDGDQFGYVPDEILPLLMQERHRWSTFHINARSGFLFREKLTIRCLAPLTSLSLALTDTTSSVACIDLSQNITSDCSRLEHLSIGMGTTICLPQIPDTLHLPHLRSLYYGNSDWGEIYENLQCILSASPNLEELKIRSQGLGQFKSSPHVLLGHVRSKYIIPSPRNPRLPCSTRIHLRQLILSWPWRDGRSRYLATSAHSRFLPPGSSFLNSAA